MCLLPCTAAVGNATAIYDNVTFNCLEASRTPPPASSGACRLHAAASAIVPQGLCFVGRFCGPLLPSWAPTSIKYVPALEGFPPRCLQARKHALLVVLVLHAMHLCRTECDTTLFGGGGGGFRCLHLPLRLGTLA